MPPVPKKLVNQALKSLQCPQCVSASAGNLPVRTSTVHGMPLSVVKSSSAVNHTEAEKDGTRLEAFRVEKLTPMLSDIVLA